MKYLRFYLKLGVAGGAPYGIAMGVVFSFLSFPLGTIVGLFSGVIFGAVMALALGSIHILAARRFASGNVDELLRARQSRTLELPLPYDEALGCCIAALEPLGKFRIRKEDRFEGTIEAVTAMNWKCFGEVVSFKLQETDAKRTRVELTSRPAFTTQQLVDYGKNLQNILAIVGFLKRLGAGDEPKGKPLTASKIRAESSPDETGS